MSRANPSTDNYTEHYAKIMSEVRDLSPEDEREKIKRWRELGDVKARDEVVKATMKVAVAVARQHQNFGLPMCDLIALGAEGIMKALSMYDLTRTDVRFATYAWHWIRAKVTRAECRQWHMVSGQPTSSRRLFSLLKALSRAQAIHGEDRDAVYAYVASEIGIHVDTAKEWLTLVNNRMLSLDTTPVYTQQEDVVLMDRLVEHNELPADEQVYSAEIRRMVQIKIRQILPSLTERQIRILRRRLLCSFSDSLEDVGREEGISRERVRQLENVLKDRLRKLLRDEAEEIGIDTQEMLDQMFECAAA